jgi:hypothetical protein
MKVILSRKGLDSENGGIPSPIIQNSYGEWRMYPIPIPRANTDVNYSDLTLFDDYKVSDFLKDVAFKSKGAETCHLDPDIRQPYLHNRPLGWHRAFGQSRTAQDHLKKFGVGEGDVFLFYGWFQFAEVKNGKFRYVKNKDYPNGFHAIYGYLQVDKVIDPNGNDVPPWLADHPHVKLKDSAPYRYKSNVVYTSTDFFFYKNQRVDKKGSILFTFSDDLILTRKGQQNRTIWELPSLFHPDNGVQLSYNPANNWDKMLDKAVLRSARRGQEFVVKADPEGKVEQWCYELITSHSVTD